MIPLRESEYTETWKELEALANERDVVRFWRRYRSYLEETNAISTARRVLHKMAGLTADTIDRLRQEESDHSNDDTGNES